VEAEAGFRSSWVRIRVILDLLEEPVQDAEVEVVVRIEAGAETMRETDRADGGGWWGRGTGLPEGGLEGPKQDVEDGAGGPGPVVEVGAQALGDGQDPLAHRHMGNDMIY